jgi:hypothetical protein
MPRTELPVRPDLGHLRRQAKRLLREVKNGDPVATALLREHHPERLEPSQARLADAQLALARSYGVPSWRRLALACRTVEAICKDDADALRELVLRHPWLLDEDARGVKGNWGPPMSYAANLGRDRIVAMLHELGASDVQYAFDRAVLQGKLDTARSLCALGARPTGETVLGACETQSSAGLALALELGAPLADGHGNRLAPVAMLLQTYCRNAEGKHRCLELFAEHGIDLPDTPPMAVHRGRSDLLERHLRRDPHLVARTFSHEEIYPPELGCDADYSLALHGTPIAGGTLLHLCVEFDELELARRLLERGADPDARAEVDADGFGGHTALFGCVVSQPHRVGRRTDDAFARLLLDHGADPNARASLRKALRDVADETLHEYRDVTPVVWGERFHDQDWVSTSALRLLAERGGHR